MKISTGLAGHERLALGLIVGCFFLCGFSTTLNDVLIPFLKRRLLLSYREVMCVELAFYLAYFTVCPWAGTRVLTWGFLNSAQRGLCLGALGCLAILPAVQTGGYLLVLPAVFTLGAGVAIIQVTVNPWALSLGNASRSTACLTFAQSFNAFGMVLAPSIGSLFLSADTGFFQVPSVYLGAGLCWIAWFLVVSFSSKRIVANESSNAQEETLFALLRKPQVRRSLAALFTYVGIEVAVGGFMVSVLSSPSVAGLSIETAARLCSLYWGGMFLGRFAASYWMTTERAGYFLEWLAAAACTFLLIASFASGYTAAVALVSVGLCNSVMYPAIFSMGMRGVPGGGPRLAGLLCMANIGGAFWPLLQGVCADVFGVQKSFLLPALGYLLISVFARNSLRRAPQ